MRVATFNIHNGIGLDANYDLDRIAATIQAVGPDIIGLQEIGRHWDAASSWDDQVATLADDLAMHCFMAPIYTLESPTPHDPPRQFGCAFLSRYPILNEENHDLVRIHTFAPEKGPQQMPGLGMIQLNVDNQTWYVYNTHLAWQSAQLRRRQIEQMKLLVREETKRNSPFIVMGDFNAEPAASEMEDVFRVWRDAWQAAGSSHGHTFPADKPSKRIDYIFVSSHVHVRAAQVVPTVGSDHCLLVADLSISL